MAPAFPRLSVATCLTAVSLAAAGCAGKPVAVHEKSLYVGNFAVDQRRYPFGTYESLRGVGFRLGFFAFGIGYYDLKVLSLSPDGVYSVDSPLGEVAVGFESPAALDSKRKGE